MNPTDVPRIWRQSPLVAKAYEEGQRAGRAGVAGDVNPWMEKGPEHGAITNGYVMGSTLHAESTDERWVPLCGGMMCAFRAPFPFRPYGAKKFKRCKHCIRVVEAEGKRLAEAWEEGRTSTHPK